MSVWWSQWDLQPSGKKRKKALMARAKSTHNAGVMEKRVKPLNLSWRAVGSLASIGVHARHASLCYSIGMVYLGEKPRLLSFIVSHSGLHAICKSAWYNFQSLLVCLTSCAFVLSGSSVSLRKPVFGQHRSQVSCDSCNADSSGERFTRPARHQSSPIYPLISSRLSHQQAWFCLS